MAISHAGHNHPATPAARSACRKANTLTLPADTGVNAVYNDYIREHIRKTAANGRMKARMDREYATRIQPRRSGARVDASNSTCVQAALHTGRGRCACGWDTMAA